MRVTASERSRGDASDIDGKTDRSKLAEAHESVRAASEFQSADWRLGLADARLDRGTVPRARGNAGSGSD